MANRSIVHVEIPAKSRDAAAKFYQELFGWEYQHMEGSMPYTTFKSGNTGGGFPDVSQNNPAGQVLVYISSDDIEADLKKAEGLGGKILMGKTEVPTFGWFGIFADPTGNPIAVWKEMAPQG